MQKKENQDSWPQNGDCFYWVRSDTGDICAGMWIKESPSCRFRQSIGNIFRSKEDAKKAIARQQEVQNEIAK